MSKPKTKIYLKRDEMVASYFLVRAWHNHAKVASAMGVSGGAISDLMRDIEKVIQGEAVKRRKHGDHFIGACQDIVKALASQFLPAPTEQLPLNPVEARPVSPLERLNKILADLPEILEERVLERTAELRNELKEAREAKPAFK